MGEGEEDALHVCNCALCKSVQMCVFSHAFAFMHICRITRPCMSLVSFSLMKSELCFMYDTDLFYELEQEASCCIFSHSDTDHRDMWGS